MKEKWMNTDFEMEVIRDKGFSAFNGV